ncbi:MAG: hypothetical protein WDN48_16505 [Pseudolabrys sp.]
MLYDLVKDRVNDTQIVVTGEGAAPGTQGRGDVQRAPDRLRVDLRWTVERSKL